MVSFATALVARSYAEHVARTRPGDHAIALSGAVAAIPVLGRHLAPLTGMAALGVGGHRYAAGIASGLARVGLQRRRTEQRRAQRDATPAILADALRDIIDPDGLTGSWPSDRGVAPFLRAAGQRRYVYRSAVRYGSESDQVLDVWRSADTGGRPAPVLVFIPGGAWVFGSRALQGHTLMAQLARQGWVCMSVQYRTSPQHRWPRQMIDVKTALAWARANAHTVGGDPNFVAIAGCSAGGHLATLAGLTGDGPQWRDHLDADADVSVDAVVSMYGAYDWHGRTTAEQDRFLEFLERVVVKRSQGTHPELFRVASPIEQVHASAPPLFAVHGSEDGIIPVQGARDFVHRLRSVSVSPVGYAELPGAGHGFDLTDAERTAWMVSAVERFLTHVHRQRRPVTPSTTAV